MTLQSSGPISLLDVQNEFLGDNLIAINEYYGVAPGIPSSGTISLSDFYGKTYPFQADSFGYSSTSSYSNAYSNYDGNIVTPGSFYSPKTFTINLSAGAGGSATLRYYEGGTLNTTWTNNFYGDYTFYFGTSSMQFTSSLYDPTTEASDPGVSSFANVQYSIPVFRFLYSHAHNLL